MTHKIVDKELTIDVGLVHTEFTHSGCMETFVWLANHDVLGYHYEFMDKFFQSTDEYSIKVKFDLYNNLVTPMIELFICGDGKFDKEDEHVFLALKNKLQKCLDELNKLEFVNRA